MQGEAVPVYPGGGWRWPRRPLLSLLVRALAFGVPVGIAVLTGLVVLMVTSHDGTPCCSCSAVDLAVACAVALLAFAALGERALTLAALLDISMQFPYRPSSRPSIALRTGSHRQLLAELRRVREALPWADGALPTGTAASADAMLSLDRAENVLTLVAVLSTLEPGTRDHSEQVAELAARLARQLKLPPEDREQLRWAALVHDIGKLTVPPEILNKPGPLTPDEWSVIYMHPFFGDRILRPLHGWLGPAARAVLEHHERWDGSGYPNGLREGQISLAGRIVAVADSFEVMRSTRVYKRSMSLQAARRELLHHAGSQFDPAVVAACLAITAGWTEVSASPRTALARVPVLAGLLSALAALKNQSAMVALASPPSWAPPAGGP